MTQHNQNPTPTFSSQATDKPGYLRTIEHLLSHYVDGMDVFKNAPNHHPDWASLEAKIKPESQNCLFQGKPLPTQWMDLQATVFGILAKDKYGLDTFPNEIRIIKSSDMIRLYSTVGMPTNYADWSFGMEEIKTEKAYQKGQMGLAYEIVINSDPAIAYCMEENSKTMQMLVTAHASFGHNSFFKSNHLFRQFTSPQEILGDINRLEKYVEDCREREGDDKVNALLDAAHALLSYGVYRNDKPTPRTPEEERQRRLRIQEIIERDYDPVMSSAKKHRSPSEAFAKNDVAQHEDLGKEENLLLLIASLAPHLEDWERNLLRKLSEQAQYFYPQRQTQVGNEGWATFWHYTLMNDFHDMGLVSDGMMLEFLSSHTAVVAQPPFDSPYYRGINPYHLGFNMYQDIKRICLNPTEEDREWFPMAGYMQFAGNPDWVSVMQHAAFEYEDESFIQQFLSPKMIRDSGFFTVEDNDKVPHLSIDAIPGAEDYRTIRNDLAAQYRLGDREPRIEAISYYLKKDRTLLLQHTIHNRCPLDEDNAKLVLQYIHQLWRHPVVLQSVTPEGEILKTFGCPKIPKVVPKGNLLITVTAPG